MITEVPGVEVGHWTDPEARTGCTVALFPEGTVASGEVRGGAPASRDFALLDPSRMVERLDAVVLSGGSAFGLASGDGVMRFLEDRGTGFETTAGPVPIVVGLSLFDLAEGDGSVRPGAAEGRAAAEAASSAPVGSSQSRMRGRFAIARAIATRPKLLIADEPTGNLDPDLSLEVMRVFRRFNEFGVTLLIASHDIALIDKLGCRRIELEGGRLQQPHSDTYIEGYSDISLPQGDGDQWR